MRRRESFESCETAAREDSYYYYIVYSRARDGGSHSHSTPPVPRPTFPHASDGPVSGPNHRPTGGRHSNLTRRAYIWPVNIGFLLLLLFLGFLFFHFYLFRFPFPFPVLEKNTIFLREKITSIVVIGKKSALFIRNWKKKKKY